MPAAAGIQILVGGLLFVGAVAAQDDLAKSQTVFAQRLQEFKQESTQAKTNVLARYRKDLDALRLGTRQNGDLDAWQAVDAEIRRFDARRGRLPTTNAAAKPPELARLVTAARDTLDKAELDYARKVIQLGNQYLQFLDQRLRQAVREDKIELAKTFKKEVEAAQNTPAYQAAQFVVAERQSAADAKTASPAATKASAASPHAESDVAAPQVPAGTARAWPILTDASAWFVELWGEAGGIRPAPEGIAVNFDRGARNKTAFGRMCEPPLKLDRRDVLVLDVASDLPGGASVAVALTVDNRYFETSLFHVKPGKNTVFFRCDSHTFKSWQSNWECRDVLPLPATVSKVDLLIYPPMAGEMRLLRPRIVRVAR